jgi:predicted transcriptional regulator of viral defense system
MLADPNLGGGIRHVADMLGVFLREHQKEEPRLADYADRLGNGAVFKRLGFILEARFPDRGELLAACRERLTAGYVKLDPKLASDRLVTVWRLWVPATSTAGAGQ